MEVLAPDISVVVAGLDDENALLRCLRSLLASLQGLTSEVIVVNPPVGVDVASYNAIAVSAPDARHVPEMWGRGLAASAGSVVAFTTAHFEVARGWARALVDEIRSGSAGAGGPIRLDDRSGLVGRAAYFLRYSLLIPPVTGGRVTFIAGDNAAYSRQALDRHRGSFERGFWEVEFHRRIASDGDYLTLVPRAEASVGDGFRFAQLAKQRYGHAVLFGRDRVSAGESRTKIVASAPLVPGVLLARIAGRASRKNVLRSFVASLPFVLPLLVCWAMGEAVGALSPAPRCE